MRLLNVRRRRLARVTTARRRAAKLTQNVLTIGKPASPENASIAARQCYARHQAANLEAALGNQIHWANAIGLISSPELGAALSRVRPVMGDFVWRSVRDMLVRLESSVNLGLIVCLNEQKNMQGSHFIFFRINYAYLPI